MASEGRRTLRQGDGSPVAPLRFSEVGVRSLLGRRPNSRSPINPRK